MLSKGMEPNEAPVASQKSLLGTKKSRGKEKGDAQATEGWKRENRLFPNVFSCFINGLSWVMTPSFHAAAGLCKSHGIPNPQKEKKPQKMEALSPKTQSLQKAQGTRPPKANSPKSLKPKTTPKSHVPKGKRRPRFVVWVLSLPSGSSQGLPLVQSNLSMLPISGDFLPSDWRSSLK